VKHHKIISNGSDGHSPPRSAAPTCRWPISTPKKSFSRSQPLRSLTGNRAR
jgi:hypothetical protein